MGTLSNQPRVKQERVVGHLQPATEAICPHADQIKNILGKTAAAGWSAPFTFVGCGEIVLGPSLIEKRNETMIEQVEKSRERSVFVEQP